MGFRRNGKIFSESIVIKGASLQNRKPTHKSHDIPFEQFYPANIFRKEESQRESIHLQARLAISLQTIHLKSITKKKYVKIFKKILDDIFYMYIYSTSFMLYKNFSRSTVYKERNWKNQCKNETIS